MTRGNRYLATVLAVATAVSSVFAGYTPRVAHAGGIGAANTAIFQAFGGQVNGRNATNGQALIFQSSTGTWVPGTVSFTGGTVTSPILFPDGTVAAPAMAYSAESDLGWYRIGSGVMGMADGGSIMFQLDNTGIKFGASIAGIPFITRSGAVLQFKLADNSAFATTQALKYATSSTNLFFMTGSGTPEGSVTGSVGAIYGRTDGGTGTTFYVKESGSATNTGWVAFAAAVSLSGITNGTTGQLQWSTGSGSINNLLGPTDQNFLITAGASGAASGRAVTVTGGAGSSGTGGGASLVGGAATTGTGGPVALTSGAASAGAGGNITITGAAGTAGNGGALTVNTGAGATSNFVGGSIVMTVGASVGNGQGSQCSFFAGQGGPTNGQGGTCQIVGGASQGSGTGGTAQVVGGAGGSTGTGGSCLVTSGAGGGTNGNSGAITLQPGAVTSGTGGSISLTGRAGVGSGQSGSGITLTAGSGPVAGGSGSGGNIVVTAGAQGSTANTSGFLSLVGGSGTSTGSGGTCSVSGGTGGGSGRGGSATFSGGSGATSSGSAGGDATFQGGDAQATNSTNGSGGTAYFKAGTPTGTGTGHAVMQTAFNGASSSTQGTHGDRLYLSGKRLALTDNTIATFATISVASGTMIAATVHYTVRASDGTDHQIETGEFNVTAVNKAGTITTNIPSVIGSTQSVSAGTLTNTFAVSTGASLVNIRVTSDSSLTPTTLDIAYQVRTNSVTTITPQ